MAAYGASIGLGIASIPVYIINVAMLHRGVSGHGSSSSSVIHLKLLADYERGRLKRSEGELLCGRGVSFDVSEKDFAEAIACSKCLELLARGSFH